MERALILGSGFCGVLWVLENYIKPQDEVCICSYCPSPMNKVHMKGFPFGIALLIVETRNVEIWFLVPLLSPCLLHGLGNPIFRHVLPRLTWHPE